ncbi:DUF1657 domain-containing protein [Clostridium nigeriense]|uniref:DUF1657 domain-containing protein n=1 Tax=Clostridium nigeriense TaxID=1805470 RepID=UPI000832C652|nr:DUF1657 domain-containing protein [Clostridium nigeriense]
MTTIAKVKQTLAILKGAESTLEIYSIQERNEEAKNIYAETSKEINKIKKDLEKRISFMEFEEPQYKGN